MVVDAVRTYLDAASGLTELSRKEAVAAAKALLRANGTVAPERTGGEALPPRVGQNIQALAGELIETSQANRAAIAALVRSEVERQLERMDVVPRDEHDRLVRRVAELERRLAARRQVPERVAAVPEPASGPAAGAADTRVAPAGDEDGGEPRPEPADEGSADTAPSATGGSASATGGSASAAEGAAPEEPDSPEGPDSPEEPEAPEKSDPPQDRAEAESKPAKVAGTSAKGRSTAKGSAKTATRSSRSRSTGKGTAAKRTTKGKGTAKK